MKHMVKVGSRELIKGHSFTRGSWTKYIYFEQQWFSKSYVNHETFNGLRIMLYFLFICASKLPNEVVALHVPGWIHSE